MSTRVEGASPPVVLVTAQATLVAGEMYLILTVKEETVNLWRYNLSARDENRIAYGKVITTGHMTALRKAAEICANGYSPGTIERGLLEAFTQDTL